MSEVQQAVAALKKAHAAKLAELEAIEKALQALGESDCRRADYAGCGIAEATKRYLREIGRPADTKEIADAIRSRGVETRSKRFVPTVYATLANAAKASDGELVRQGGVWALRSLAGS